VRSLRRAGTLDQIRAEIEASLGVQFVPDDTDNDPLFTCSVPASQLRLNSWVSPDKEGWQVFNFIGEPPEPPDGSVPDGENISVPLAAVLREAGNDWYVPSINESFEDSGVLGDELLDRDVIVSVLAPQWLSALNSDEREAGTKLLESIANQWLSAAQRTADPLADVRRRKAELQRQFVEPKSRLRILASYAANKQLSS
jgi:hypothetical protein